MREQGELETGHVKTLAVNWWFHRAWTTKSENYNTEIFNYNIHVFNRLLTWYYYFRIDFNVYSVSMF